MPHNKAPSRRVIAITGASSGIGAALAEAYAAPGIRLALAGRRQAALEEVAERCEKRGASVDCQRFDMADTAAARRWFDATDDRHSVDLVIANAGISSSIGADGEPEPWSVIEQVIAVNLLGSLAVANAAAERMRARRSGQIVLMSSLAGLRGLPFCPSYSASKAGLAAYGEALRGWLAPYGVAVSVVAPGYVVSPMSDRLERLTDERSARRAQNGTGPAGARGAKDPPRHRAEPSNDRLSPVPLSGDPAAHRPARRLGQSRAAAVSLYGPARDPVIASPGTCL
jgi:short-subunit dehydrogenase